MEEGEENEAEVQVSLTGEITDMASRVWSGGWTFGKLRETKKGFSDNSVVKITGCLEGFRIGMLVSVLGHWKNTKYGTEFVVDTIVEDTPRSWRGIRAWLIERIPQIGPKRAEEVASRFGDGIWEIIEKDPGQLGVISGLTPDRIDAIKAAYASYKSERDKYVAYYDLSLNRSEITKALKNELTPEHIAADPFMLYLIPNGVSFNRAELIATFIGAPMTAESRLIAACIEAARDAALDGHTAIEADWCVEHAAARTGVMEHLVDAALQSAVDHGHMVVAYGLMMLPALDAAERLVADKITRAKPFEEIDEHHTGSDPGGSGQHDPQEANGDSDWAAWQREDHHPEDRAGAPATQPEGLVVRTDGEGGEADGGGDFVRLDDDP